MIIRITKTNGTIKSNISLHNILQSLEDGVYTIEVKKQRLQRSIGQNAYFHGVIVPYIAEYMGEIAKEYGNIPQGLENAKEALINKYLPKKVVKNKLDKRRKIQKQKRTSDCDTKEFKEFIDKILNDFPEIPPPESSDLTRIIEHYQNTYGI